MARVGISGEMPWCSRSPPAARLAASPARSPPHLLVVHLFPRVSLELSRATLTLCSRGLRRGLSSPSPIPPFPGWGGGLASHRPLSPLLLIGIRGDASQPGPPSPALPCSVPDRRVFVGEREGVRHPESRGQQPRGQFGHGDSGDAVPEGRGMLLKGAPHPGIGDGGGECCGTPEGVQGVHICAQSSMRVGCRRQHRAVPAGPFPRSGSQAHAELPAAERGVEHKTSPEAPSLSQSPSRSGVGGRGGCLARESWHAARASPPPRQDCQRAASTKETSRGAVPGEKHPPCVPQPARAHVWHQHQGTGLLIHPPSDPLAHVPIPPGASPSRPVLLHLSCSHPGLSPSSAARSGHWHSLAGNTSHAQPAPSERGLLCYSFPRQLLFHLSPCFATMQLTASSRVLVVLSF